MSMRHIERFTSQVHKDDTEILAIQMGFDENQARVIAEACNNIDYYEDTKPTNPDSSAQSWHFNVWGGQDGTVHDSRIIHAIECLNRAISSAACPSSPDDETLRHLGHGLHSLQDLFAHAKKLVSTAKDSSMTGWGLYFASFFADVPKNSVCPCSHRNILSSAPDNRDYIHPTLSPSSKVHGEQNFSQRYSDAVTATKLYLVLFWNMLNRPIPSAVISEIKNRISTSNSAAFNSLLRSFGKTLESMESVAHCREGDFLEWQLMKSMPPTPAPSHY